MLHRLLVSFRTAAALLLWLGFATVVAAADPADTRTKEEVDELIRKEGRTPPEWFAATKLNYPSTLDLSWPQQPPAPWDNTKNVGQFIWDVINPNPGRWREGIKFVHHLLTLQKDDPALRERDMLTLGRMYHNLLQDYARAAFWFRTAGADDAKAFGISSIPLAHCYWKLGSKSMALHLLDQIDPPRFDMIKPLSDMGETERALSIARSYFGYEEPSDAYLAAGDACRLAGRYQEAMDYYRLAIDKTPAGAQHHAKRDHDRARDSLEAIRLFDLSDVNKVPSGAYRAESIGYEAQIEVEVTVRDRRITKVEVTRHKEKQFYSALTDTPRNIIAKQGVKGIDTTSSATITSEAIINATAKALAGGTKKQ